MANFDGSRGRLLLWNHALSQCQQLLALAERADEEIESGRALEKTDRDNPERQAYIESLPDYQPGGPLKFSFFQARDMFPSDFGNFAECIQIRDACRMLAIIFFCQPFNIGNPGEGVAKNDRKFREQHVPLLLAAAFFSQADRDDFLQLLERLKDARDKVIAHGDASFFQYADNGSISALRMHAQCLKGIDFKQFATLLEPFVHAVTNFALQAPLVDGGVGKL